MQAALRIALWFGLGYAVLAAMVIANDRRPHGGSWISLAGLVSYLVTFPVSLLAEKLGHRLDHRSNAHMLLAVLGTATLLVVAVALLLWPFTARGALQLAPVR